MYTPRGLSLRNIVSLSLSLENKWRLLLEICVSYGLSDVMEINWVPGATLHLHRRSNGCHLTRKKCSPTHFFFLIADNSNNKFRPIMIINLSIYRLVRLISWELSRVVNSKLVGNFSVWDTFIISHMTQ